MDNFFMVFYLASIMHVCFLPFNYNRHDQKCHDVWFTQQMPS